MAGNKQDKFDRGSMFQRRFNEKYRESVFEKLPKRPFFQFLEILLTKIGRLILLNFMYICFLGPLIYVLLQILSAYNDGYNLTKMLLFTLAYFVIAIFFGPATAGFTYILRKTIEGDSVSLVNDFMEQLKNNFKQGLFMGLFDAIAIFSAAIYFEFIFEMFTSNVSISLPYVLLMGLLSLATVIYFTMRYYVYLMMVTVELKMSELLRNAVAFVFIGAPSNIMNFVIFVGLLTAVILLIPYSIFVVVLFGLSFVGLMLNFTAYIQVKKHLIDPVHDPNESKEDEKIFSDEPQLHLKSNNTDDNHKADELKNTPAQENDASK